MIDPKKALLASARYLREHPAEILRQLKNGSRLRFGLPVAALQWLATEFESSSSAGPKDIEISAAPPGVRVRATVEQMGTPLRADCVVIVERVILDATQARVELRLKNVTLALLDNALQTPLAALIRSGTLDVSRLASLVAYLPSRPAVLVEAVNDRVVLDLMKIPKLANKKRFRHWIGILTSLMSVDSIASDTLHVDLSIRALPRGLSGVFK